MDETLIEELVRAAHRVASLDRQHLDAQKSTWCIVPGRLDALTRLLDAAHALSIRELEAALELEKAEHAETLRRYEERSAEADRFKQIVRRMLANVPEEFLREELDAPF